MLTVRAGCPHGTAAARFVNCKDLAERSNLVERVNFNFERIQMMLPCIQLYCKTRILTF